MEHTNLRTRSKYCLDNLALLLGNAILRPEITKYKPILNTGKNKNSKQNINNMYFRSEYAIIKNIDVVNTYKAVIAINHTKQKNDNVKKLKEIIKELKLHIKQIENKIDILTNNNIEENEKINKNNMLKELASDLKLNKTKLQKSEEELIKVDFTLEEMQAYRALKILADGDYGAEALRKKILRVLDGKEPHQNKVIHDNSNMRNHNEHSREVQNHRPVREPYRYEDKREKNSRPSEKVLEELREQKKNGKYIMPALMKYLDEKPEVDKKDNLDNTNLISSIGIDLNCKPLTNTITQIKGAWAKKIDISALAKIKEEEETEEVVNSFDDGNNSKQEKPIQPTKLLPKKQSPNSAPSALVYVNYFIDDDGEEVEEIVDDDDMLDNELYEEYKSMYSDELDHHVYDDDNNYSSEEITETVDENNNYDEYYND